MVDEASVLIETLEAMTAFVAVEREWPMSKTINWPVRVSPSSLLLLLLLLPVLSDGLTLVTCRRNNKGKRGGRRGREVEREREVARERRTRREESEAEEGERGRVAECVNTDTDRNRRHRPASPFLSPLPPQNRVTHVAICGRR